MKGSKVIGTLLCMALAITQIVPPTIARANEEKTSTNQELTQEVVQLSDDELLDGKKYKRTS